MKKLLLLSLFLLAAVGVNAQLSIKPGSFGGYSDNDRAAGDDMGHRNMTAQMIDWPMNADGDDNLALLIVNFENMAPEDISQVQASLSGGAIVAKTEDRKMENGTVNRWYFIPEGSNMDVTFTHPRFGNTRLPGVNFDIHKIYYVTVVNATTVPVVINTEPAGAFVNFDGRSVGYSPATIPDVTMGMHRVEIIPTDTKMTQGVRPHDIMVTVDNAAFNYPILKKRTISLQPNPANAHLTVMHNGKLLGEGDETIILKDAEYGNYTVIGTYKEAMLTRTIEVNDDTDDVITINVIGSRAISFTATQNNREVNADVAINGVTVGTTPMTRVLDYGKYNVTMSSMGYSKSTTLRVNKNTNDCRLNLPTRRSAGWNPFRTGYKEREWGLVFNYIRRYFSLKQGGRSHKYDWVGNEGEASAFQVGIAYQPYFVAGQGLNTGVYFQITPQHLDDNWDVTDLAFFIPLQYQFRLPLSRDFSIAVNAGMAMTIGVHNELSERNSDTESGDKIDVGYGHNSEYNTYFPDAFDYSLLFGVAVQFKALQIEGKYSLGLKNHEVMLQDQTCTYKSGFMGIGLSLLF